MVSLPKDGREKVADAYLPGKVFYILLEGEGRQPVLHFGMTGMLQVYSTLLLSLAVVQIGVLRSKGKYLCTTKKAPVRKEFPQNGHQDSPRSVY